ncbi:carcinoembryonic antigen-related cell adhesion molecule 5-like [Heptranchias perlo]|uniref:carcinoembryonic antigen-related cell adhesion molecule 5-like n=1 Tax=Heptranchias perlo TaxID=212740 RepID=UPI00355A55A4
MKRHGFPLLVYSLFISSVKSHFFTIVNQQQQIEAAVGGHIVLRVRASSDVRSGSWRFSCTDVAVWIGNATDINNNYSGRAELLGIGSLSLKSLSVNDSGEYVVTMNPSSYNGSVTSRIDLNVLEPVSNPEIVASVSQTLEDNGTVTLNCNLSGDSPSIRWIKNGHFLQYNDRMNLSSDNQTLTITFVNRSDSGNYQCEGHNPVSNKTSDPFFLTVYYGPEAPQISTDPDKRGITLGSNVTFMCSVQSFPPSEFEWFLNGEHLEQKERQMTIVNIGLNDSGYYTCRAYNNMTRKYTNTTQRMNVIEPVSKPEITVDVLHPIEHNDTVTLTCNVTGDVSFLEWIKNNQHIQIDERIKISPDNTTMTVTSVNRSDSGTYRCNARSPANNETSDPFRITIWYGPDTPQLTIVDEKEAYTLESNVTFKCSADSLPPASFEWLLNGKSLQQKSQEPVIFNIARDGFGNYTCKAYNNGTKRYSATTKRITEVEGITKPKITANPLHPIEHNDTVTLTCDVSGHLRSLVWSQNQYVLNASENMKLSKGNKTLTISAVERSDAGNYTCKAKGPIGDKESDLFQLTIYYGPDEPQIFMNPEEAILSYGSNVTLTCKVESLPPSEFKWYLNGISLPQNEKQLIISNISKENSGNYTCETHNKETNLSKRQTIQVVVSKTMDLADYKTKSWVAAGVVCLLVVIAICACIIIKKRQSSG